MGNTLKLLCPSHWDGADAIAFINRLPELALMEGLVIDFSEVLFVKPFGTVLIADGLRNLVATRRAHALKTNALGATSDAHAISYLRHIGFFEYIGLKIGKQPGEARGGANYVPISVITLDSLNQAANGRRFQHGVEVVSEQLADVIYPRITEGIMMQYCLREIIRNVFEHAETDRCTVLAQRYPNGYAEIAIADGGIGIYIRPGVSRVTHRQNNDEWDNSGYGLYLLSQLGQDLGEFILASNGRYLRLSNHAHHNGTGELAFPGTAVKLLVDLEAADYFPNRLTGLVSAGERAHFDETGTVKAASKRSTITKSGAD
jgi:hypothetical protein